MHAFGVAYGRFQFESEIRHGENPKLCIDVRFRAFGSAALRAASAGPARSSARAAISSTVFAFADASSTESWPMPEKPVAQMHWDLADLGSRMRGVAMASIDLPDDALIYALLEKYFTDRQLLAPPTMLRYLISRMERSFDTIHKVAAALDWRSIADKKPLSVGLARLVLRELQVPRD